MSLKILSLFSGIGAFEEALSNLKVDFDLVNYCEFQEDIAKAYSIIHNTPIEKNLGDITKVDEKQLEDFDLMTYGFPCITGDALIRTKRGLVPLKDVKVGDYVLTHKGRFKKVLNFFNQGVKEIWEVTINSEITVRTTNNHKFYIKEELSQEPKWLACEDIKLTDYFCIRTESVERWVRAKEIENARYFETVYDIEVEDDHSFTANGVIAHNCQDISALGTQKGLFEEDGTLTRSGLFFEAMRIAEEKKPKYMIAENVRALVSKPMKNSFEGMLKLIDALGYNSYWKVMNSKDYGIPHSRNRVFIVSIRKDIDDNSFVFPEPIELKIKAKDLYDKGDIADEFYLEEKHEKYYNEMRLKKKYSSLNSDVLVCMTTKQGGKSNPQNFIKDSKGARILTDSELMVFQGFRGEYGPLLRQNGFTTTKIGYMAGNSITVNVLEEIFKVLIPQEIPTVDKIEKVS